MCIWGESCARSHCHFFQQTDFSTYAALIEGQDGSDVSGIVKVIGHRGVTDAQIEILDLLGGLLGGGHLAVFPISGRGCEGKGGKNHDSKLLAEHGF